VDIATVDLTHVDLKIILGVIVTAISSYISVSVMLGKINTKIEFLEKEVDNHGAWKEKLVDTLRDFSVVLAKVEGKLDELDRNVSRLQDRKGP
jgi:hypothetical protein